MTKRVSDRPPVAVAAAAALGAAFLVLPVAGLVARTSWADLAAEVAAPEVRTALRLSLVCSLGATALSAALGLPLAWVLARSTVPGRRLLRALATLPLVLPPVVGGVALLVVFGRQGFLGRGLADWFGVRLPFTTAGAVVAEAFVAMPFLVLGAESAFRSADRRYEDAARTLGAGGWTRFRRVTLPLAAPALGAGALLAWARALGEFGATVTFAGNAPGRTQTLPLQVFVLLESGHPERAVAVSLVLLAFSVFVLAALRGRWLGAR